MVISHLNGGLSCKLNNMRVMYQRRWNDNYAIREGADAHAACGE